MVSCIYAVKALSCKLALDTFTYSIKCNIVRPDVFFLLLSCTCYSGSCLCNSAVAILVTILFELRCRFTFFSATDTNVLVKICENNCFSSFNAEAKPISGGRFALVNCPKNTQLPVGHIDLKTQEHCFLYGMWAMESVHICLHC